MTNTFGIEYEFGKSVKKYFGWVRINALFNFFTNDAFIKLIFP